MHGTALWAVGGRAGCAIAAFYGLPELSPERGRLIWQCVIQDLSADKRRFPPAAPCAPDRIMCRCFVNNRRSARLLVHGTGSLSVNIAGAGPPGN